MPSAVISAIATVGSTLMSGIAASQQASYQAQVAKNNAIIARQNENAARQAGQAQAEAASLKGAANSGMIKAALAANGVDVNTGSAVDVEASGRQENKLTTDNVLHNADLQAYGYRTQATNFQAQAGLYNMQAGSELTGGILGSIGALGSKWSTLPSWITGA